jgi:hypothetical protein
MLCRWRHGAVTGCKLISSSGGLRLLPCLLSASAGLYAGCGLR